MRWRWMQRGRAKPDAALKIAVPILPHIANFDDLDPLDAEPSVDLVRVRPGTALPGRRRSRHPAGLEGDHRRSRGAARSRLRHRHRRASSAAAAWCSGCAAAIRCSAARSPTPTASKGRPATVDGLGLLDVETTLSAEKRLDQGRGHDRPTARPFAGYEMHMGVTEGPDCARPFARLADGAPEGAMSADGRVIGTYIHGLFADDRPARGLAGALRRRQATSSLTTRWSRRRSTGSPRISQRISISTGCSS